MYLTYCLNWGILRTNEDTFNNYYSGTINLENIGMFTLLRVTTCQRALGNLFRLYQGENQL